MGLRPTQKVKKTLMWRTQMCVRYQRFLMRHRRRRQLALRESI
jgi:hypothetical protein